MTAPVRGWAVVDPEGGILPASCRHTKSQAMASFHGGLDWWKLYQKEGYTVIRVTITPEETK